MPRNGSGTYVLPTGNPVTSGQLITTSWANTTMNDLASAITQSISKDGQTIPTGNQTMGGFNHTNVANASLRNQYPAFGQVQDSTSQWLSSVAGTDTITAVTSPVITSYVAGQTFRFVSAGSNLTTAVTLSIDSLTAISVTKNGSNALAIGDIPSGAVVEVAYDGTRFQLISATAAYNLALSALATATSAIITTASTGSVKLTVGTVAQRDASPVNGYIRFNTDLVQFEGYNGTAWGSIGGGATGGVGSSAFYENDIAIVSTYTITTNKNAMSAGPITVNNSVTVTVPNGSVWSIV